MRLKLRCVSVLVLPSDASGFTLDVEVADCQEVLYQVLSKEQLLSSTDDQLRWLFGDEQFENDVACGQRAIDAAFIQCGLIPTTKETEA